MGFLSLVLLTATFLVAAVVAENNYSCIFDNYRTFSYLHIGYVSYFNVSARQPIYATTDECLDTCTADCSCSAAVYDVPHDSCYQYHNYIRVESVPLMPVNHQDTISAYIKVQRGFDRNPYYSAAARNSSLLWTILATLAALPFLV